MVCNIKCIYNLRNICINIICSQSFLDAINDVKGFAGLGYTKTSNLSIGYEYKITNCLLKKTSYGEKIALYLMASDGSDLWIFLPKAFVKIFPPKTPYKKLKEQNITHVMYNGTNKDGYKTPIFQFICKSI